MQLAQKADVDLLVIGNRGHGPLVGMFLGGVALRLIQNAPLPVLMVTSRGRMARMQADLEQEGAAPAVVPCPGRPRPNGNVAPSSSIADGELEASQTLARAAR